jgi:hypothetical protein
VLRMNKNTAWGLANDAVRLWLILAGFICFAAAALEMLSYASMTAAGGFLWLWRYQPQLRSKISRLFVPVALGLWALPMRFFYWDQFDYQNRWQSLGGLVLLLIFIQWLRISRLPKKCLLVFNRQPLWKRVLWLFLAIELIFIAASAVITLKGITLGGDEPHYLAVAQSMVQDGDINVFNQYFRGTYQSFYEADKFPAHAHFGVGHKKMISYHLPGLPFTLAPLMGLSLPKPVLYVVIRSYLGLFGALLGVMVYLWLIRLFKQRSLALLGSLLFSLTVPVFFYSIHIYAELQALLLLLAALYVLTYPAAKAGWSVLLGGFFLGSLVFWGLRYNVFIYGIAFLFTLYFLKKKNYWQIGQLLLFPMLFQGLFFYLLYTWYGNFSITSIYYGLISAEQKVQLYQTLLQTISWKMRLETWLDFFFDQRDGLFLYNPLYFFSLAGLLLALRKWKLYWQELMIVALGFVYIAYVAFSTVRPGVCPQGRYVLPMIWGLVWLVIIFYKNTKNQVLKKIFVGFIYYSLWVCGYQLFHPETLYQPTTHEILSRPGLMFQQWSNLCIYLPDWLPSFIKVPGNFNYLPNIFFLLLLAVVSWWSLRSVSKRLSDIVLPVIWTGLIALMLLFPEVILKDAKKIDHPQGYTYGIAAEQVIDMKNGNVQVLFMSKRKQAVTVTSVRPLNQIVLTIENNSRSQIKMSLHYSLKAKKPLKPIC